MEKKLFHGSSKVVTIPDLTMSREDLDFGRGFYLSPDPTTAAKWACRKSTSICNEYIMDEEDLAIYRFNLDQEWLDYVVRNRELDETQSPFDEYDVLIGAIADDKLFHTIELYTDGFISAEIAVKIMNCMNYGIQYVLKSEKAVSKIKKINHVLIQGEEKQKYKELYKTERKLANDRTESLLKEFNGRG